jgi:hypothetical protein
MGVKKEVFDAMSEVLSNACAEKHKRCGRHANLPVADQPFMSLKYWRQYVTPLFSQLQFIFPAFYRYQKAQQVHLLDEEYLD